MGKLIFENWKKVKIYENPKKIENSWKSKKNWKFIYENPKKKNPKKKKIFLKKKNKYIHLNIYSHKSCKAS